MTCKCDLIDYPALGRWRFCNWCNEQFDIQARNAQRASSDLSEVAQAMRELAYELRTSSRRPVFVANRPSQTSADSKDSRQPDSNRYTQPRDA